MPYRSEELITGEYYHVFNRSIAKFRIFDNPQNCDRFFQVMQYYRAVDPGVKFCRFLEGLDETGRADSKTILDVPLQERQIDIVAYCLMPTHIHFILKQLCDGGISRFMANIQNSYTRYFNTRHNRNGPLWSGRFKSILIDSQEYLLHLTCYIHLNPATAGLVEHPDKWRYSSFAEYCRKPPLENKICNYDELLEMVPEEYQKFVEDRIADHKELRKIRHLILE